MGKKNIQPNLVETLDKNANEKIREIVGLRVLDADKELFVSKKLFDECLPGAPKHISLDVTPKCNLNCKHCFHKATDIEELSLEEWGKIIDDFIDMGAELFTIAGRETTAYTHISKLLKILDSRKKTRGIKYGIVTNGTLIKYKIEEWRDLQIDYFDVSIDGLREEHDALRGEGVFERALEGLRLARDNGVAEKIFVVSVFHSQNWKKIPDMIKYFYEKENIRNFQLGVYFDNPRGSNYDLILSKKEFEEALLYLNDNIPLGADVSVEISEPSMQVYNDILHKICPNELMFDKNGMWYKDLGNVKVVYSNICRSFAGLYRLAGKYVIPGCGSLTDSNKWKKYCAGNLLEDSLENILEKAREIYFKEVIEKIKDKDGIKTAFGGDYFFDRINGRDFMSTVVPE